jgi:hypothetical protein
VVGTIGLPGITNAEAAIIEFDRKLLRVTREGTELT